MAEAILKRTVFYDDADGKVRPHDWALTHTTLGPMMEPFPGCRYTANAGGTQYDASDIISMVNEIKPMSLDLEKRILGDVVHGGYLMPRTGR